MRALVAGGGGFIGGHLVGELLADGHEVVAVDKKPSADWEITYLEAENHYSRDLSYFAACERVVRGCDRVYMLAADMGGMGFIESHKTECMLSVLPSTQMLVAAELAGVERYFYSSSACVYAADKQTEAAVTALKEADAYPAEAEDGYGWEKLFTERMCRHFREDMGLETRVARFHNVYGPQGTWTGGREKAPAAICRKVAEAKLSGVHEIDIWGDGEQTRSFMYVKDCVKGIKIITEGDFVDPINLGSSELVSINQLVTFVEQIADVKLRRSYDLSAPQGVRGRNSDNSLILAEFGWEPSISLQAGLDRTFAWVYDQVLAAS